MFPKTTCPRVALLAIDGETMVVADYMKARFMFLQNGGHVLDNFVRHPNHWSLDFAIEADHAVDVMLRAFNNQGT